MGKKRPVFEYKGLDGLRDAIAGLPPPSSSSNVHRTHPTSELPRPPRRSHPHRRRRRHHHHHRRRHHHHHHHHRRTHYNDSEDGRPEDAAYYSRQKRQYAAYRRHHRSRAVPPDEYDALINAPYRRRPPDPQYRYRREHDRDFPDRDPAFYPAAAAAAAGAAGAGALGYTAAARPPNAPLYDSPDAAPPGYAADKFDHAANVVDSNPNAPSINTHLAAAGLAAGAAAGVAPGRVAAGRVAAYADPDNAPPPPMPKHYPQPPGSSAKASSSSDEGIRDRLKNAFGKITGAESSDDGKNDSDRKSKRDSKESKKSDSDDDDDGSEEKGRTKRSLFKAAAVAAGALVVGTVVKKFLSHKERKENELAAQNAAVGADGRPAIGPDGELIMLPTEGQILTDVPPGVNPLQMVPQAAKGMFLSVPDVEAVVVERSGKYNRLLRHGSNFVMPGMDKLAYRHSLREVGVSVPTQQCYSRDNISVTATGLMFVRTEDPVAASYAIENPFYAVYMLVQAAMKTEVGKLSVDEAFGDRAGLANRILRTTNEAARPWGLRVTRFDLSDMDIPPELRASIGREAEAERLRRADILYSEGQREALINRADAEMQAQMRLSQARQLDVVNQAIGEAHAIHERGEAVASAMRDVAQVVREPGGEAALRLRIAEQYINAYAQANNNNNRGAGGGAAGVAADGTGPLPHDPAQVVAAMNDAIGMLTTLGDPARNAVGQQEAAAQGQGSAAAAAAAAEAAAAAQHGYETDGFYNSSQGGQFSEQQSQAFDYASTNTRPDSGAFQHAPQYTQAPPMVDPLRDAYAPGPQLHPHAHVHPHPYEQ